LVYSFQATSVQESILDLQRPPGEEDVPRGVPPSYSIIGYRMPPALFIFSQAQLTPIAKNPNRTPLTLAFGAEHYSIPHGVNATPKEKFPHLYARTFEVTSLEKWVRYMAMTIVSCCAFNGKADGTCEPIVNFSMRRCLKELSVYGAHHHPTLQPDGALRALVLTAFVMERRSSVSAFLG
jgi:hypothetical protein